MKEPNPDEMKKSVEFLTQHEDTVEVLAKNLEGEFEKSAEGKEALFLKKIVNSYVKNFDNFIAHFISGEQGKRGVDLLINGLEHPESQVKPDEKLLNKLKKLSADLKRSEFPTAEEVLHYEALKTEFSKLVPMTDIHEFIKRFNELLVKAVRFKHTKVAIAVKEKSQKDLQKTIALENFEFSISVWKFIFSRLYRPDQAGKAGEILGSKDFKDIEEKIAEKLKMNAEEVKKEIALNFTKEREDNDMTNLMAFANRVVEQGRSNVLIRVLEESGHGKYAALLFTNQFGKKGEVKTDPKTVNATAALITKMDTVSVREQVEISARDELSGMISIMLRDMKIELGKERGKFEKVLSERVIELEKAHAKNLAEVEKMKKSSEDRNKHLAVAGLASNEVVLKIEHLQKSRTDYYTRAVDILSVLRARVALAQFSINGDEAKLNSELEKIMEKAPAKFAVDAINRMHDVFFRRSKNLMTVDEFQKSLNGVDAFIEKLNLQIEHIAKHQLKVSDDIVGLAENLNDASYNAGLDIEEAQKEAMEEDRKIRKMGLESTREQVTRNQWYKENN